VLINLIFTRQKPQQKSPDPILGTIPTLDKPRIIPRFINDHQNKRTVPFDDKFDRAAALFPWTSTFSEDVMGTKISHNPIANNTFFKSSLMPRTAKKAVVSLSTE
jgi:hypothetical protein